MTLTNHNNVIFFGDNMRFAPHPFHKSTFQDYKPYQVPTHHLPIKKMTLHSYYSKFPHLEQFSINKSNFKHPHLKELHTDPVKIKYELYKVPHLGIKSEMERKSRPNEIKLEMGMGDKATIKDFVRSNLQEEVGEENPLTRHRDEQNYNITVLPFEEQYLNFLREKEQATHEFAVKQDIQNSDMLSTKDKENMIQDIDKGGAEAKLKQRRKKLKVEPIKSETELPNKSEKIEMELPNKSEKIETELPNKSEKIPTIDVEDDDESLAGQISKHDKHLKDDLEKINNDLKTSLNKAKQSHLETEVKTLFQGENFKSKNNPTKDQIALAKKAGVSDAEMKGLRQAGLLRKINNALKQGEKGFVQQEVGKLNKKVGIVPRLPRIKK